LALGEKYLDERGYKTDKLICYEIFHESPANIPYEYINKNILIPVTAQ